MKASVEDQQTLLRVQELDTRLRQLVHRARSLPELADLASVDRDLDRVREDLVVNQTQVSDLTRQQAKADADVQLVRDRASRDQQRLQAGGNAKDLQALEHELQSLARRQSDLEDVELEVMERLETAQREQTETEAKVAQLVERQTDLTGRRDAQLATIRTEHQQVSTERASTVEPLPAPLMALYSRVAEHGGNGAAALLDGQCGGCRLQLNPGDLATIRAAAPDEVVQCEECSAILIRT